MSTPPPPSLEDYDAIAAAVMETERGRWFLQEFARRNRAADTAQILDALAMLEARMRLQPSAPDLVGRPDDTPTLLSAGSETSAEVRPTPALMLAPPIEVEPDVAELAVVPPLDEAPAGLDIDYDDVEPIDEPAPPIPVAWTRVADEAADLLRTPPSRTEPTSQPSAVRGNPGTSRPAALLESLSDAEKALLFA